MDSTAAAIHGATSEAPHRAVPAAYCHQPDPRPEQGMPVTDPVDRLVDSVAGSGIDHLCAGQAETATAGSMSLNVADSRALASRIGAQPPLAFRRSAVAC